MVSKNEVPPEEVSGSMPKGSLGGGYSIRVTSRLTGISAHTLRMWERRYGFPEPDRTAGGARRYSVEDVDQLKLVARAIEAGFRPNEVVAKPREELEQIVAQQVLAATRPQGVLSPSLERTLELIQSSRIDDVRAELRAAVAVLGPKRFVSQFAAPLVEQVGVRWADGSLTIQQEHFFTELISTQIRSLIAGYEGLEGRPCVLLTSLSGELHSLGIQMVALYSSLCGGTARLLGPNAPVEEILVAVQSLDVQVVGVSISTASTSGETARKLVVDQLQRLLVGLPRKVELWVGGRGAQLLPLDRSAIRLVSDLEALDHEFERWRAK